MYLKANSLVCNSLFVADVSKMVKIKFDESIPNRIRPLIVETIYEAEQIISDLVVSNLNADINIELASNARTNSFYFSESSNSLRNSIILTKTSFKLTKKSFKALIAHEYAHLVINKNFRYINGISIAEYLKNHRKPNEYITSHMSIAELLADLMAVLVVNDPTVVTHLLRELDLKMPLYAHEMLRSSKARYFSRAELDYSEFGSRDFSVDPSHPNWANYHPEINQVHILLNQVRAHIWIAWMAKIPKSKRGEFFVDVLRAFAKLFRSGDFRKQVKTLKIEKLNGFIIDYLDRELKDEFNES